MTDVGFISHRHRQPAPEAEEAEEEEYVPYVPLAVRREARFHTLASKGGKEKQHLEDLADLEKEKEDEMARKREKARRERTLLDNAAEVKRKKMEADALKSEEQLRLEEEDKLIKELAGQQRKLASNAELAQGVEYGSSLPATYVFVSFLLLLFAPFFSFFLLKVRKLNMAWIWVGIDGRPLGTSETKRRKSRSRFEKSIICLWRGTTCHRLLRNSK